MSTVVDDLARLVAANLDAAGPAELTAHAATASRIRSWLDAFDTRVVVHLRHTQPDRDPADALRHRGRRESNAVTDRAATTAHVPEIGDALADGTITAGHVDGLTRAANTLDDTGRDQLAAHGAELAGAAATMTPEQFGRHCHHLARNLARDAGLSRHEHIRRQRHVRRWVCRDTGLHKTVIALDALTDAAMWNALDAVVAAARADTQDDGVSFQHLQCDAIVAHITNTTSGTVERVPEVTVLIDLDTLITGLHDHGTCETSAGHDLPVDTLRRLCCDAEIIPVVLGRDGDVVDVGRANRLANRAQRRALRAMYRTCGHPDCDTPFDACRIHHVTHWCHGGASDLANLLPLCERHHHLVHEEGWQLTMTPDRVITLTRPDHTVVHHGPTIDRRPGSTRPDVTTAPPPPRWHRPAPPSTTDLDDEIARLAHQLEETCRLLAERS